MSDYVVRIFVNDRKTAYGRRKRFEGLTVALETQPVWMGAHYNDTARATAFRDFCQEKSSP